MLPTVITNKKYPTSIIEFGTDFPQIYPTQKPVSLCKWLIKTYTNEGETVLDNCAGSGSTLLAAQATGRGFVGIDLSDDACHIAVKRLEGTIRQIEGQGTIFDQLREGL
jgi:DNA modification methylase